MYYKESVYDILTGFAKDGVINFENSVIVKMEGDGAYLHVPKDNHETVTRICDKLRSWGFSVREKPYTDDEDYTVALIVILVRAEDKLTGEYYQDYPKDIIAHGPIIRAKGYNPHRVVLRHKVLGAIYVVHTQIIPDGIGSNCRPYFTEGHYYQYESDRPAAIEKFQERMMLLEKMAYPELYKS